jgi:hypothetical protein
MSFEGTKILKFSEVINNDSSVRYKNLEKFDDKVAIIQNIPQYDYRRQILKSHIESFYEKIKNYETIIFDNCEHIWIDSWIELLIMLNKTNKNIILTTFSIGIRFYLDKVIPNNKIHFNTIHTLFQNHIHPYTNIFYKHMGFLKKRKYLLKFFSYNRTPHRDYVIDFLLKNNLTEGNNISFHNFPFETLNDVLDLKSANFSYRFYESDKILENVDFKVLNNLRIIPKIENFNIENQTKQIEKNSDASLNSYFEIITEAQMPFSKDPTNSLYYTYSITKRTLIPLLFGNVFHIMPECKLFEDELTNAGFQLFFKNDEDFLNNLNEDFYFNSETQYKIQHNHNLLNELYGEVSGCDMFILQKIEEIYQTKYSN